MKYVGRACCAMEGCAFFGEPARLFDDMLFAHLYFESTFYLSNTPFLRQVVFAAIPTFSQRQLISSSLVSPFWSPQKKRKNVLHQANLSLALALIHNKFKKPTDPTDALHQVVHRLG